MKKQKENSRESNNLSVTNKMFQLKQDNEKRILQNFPFLEDPKQQRSYFCSYDSHPDEKYLVEFWKDLLEIIYETTFNTFTAKLGDVLDLTKIKGKRPIGLPNLIKKLNEDNFFVYEKDLLSDEYFRKYHPEVIPKPSFFGSIKKGAYSYVSSYFYTTEVEPSMEDNLINIKLFKVFNRFTLTNYSFIVMKSLSK